MKRLPTRTEPQVAAFLRAIKETPDDDTPRLIFADWLEDHDDPRGEMIRLSCELARIPHPGAERTALCNKLRPWDEDGEMLRAWVPNNGNHRLKVRVERGLLQLDVDEEAKADRDTDQDLFAAIDQGWVETASASFHDALGRVLDDHWKQELRQALEASGASWAVFAGSEGEPDWYEGEEPYTDDWELARARELSNLSFVGAARGTFTDRTLAYLSGHPALRTLYLHGNFTPIGLAHLTTLTSLELVDVAWFRGLQPEDVHALVRLGRVRKLTVGIENLDDAGFRGFRAMPWLEELLCYTPNGVTPEALRELQSALPHCRLRNLR
jgi:uncharacterized protein (TIGR02996 family)